MSRLTKRNLHNIKSIFQEKTGVELNPDHGPHPSVGKVVLLSAVIVFCMGLAAFTYPLFTPLNGDELSLSATYEGGGIVSIFVENGSDRDLKFQEQLKLMRWLTSEEVETLGGTVMFENTSFPAHSSGTMTVDLSKAYDMEALEHPEGNPEWYYLLLTNNGFLFGHDWMCSVDFAQARGPEDENPAPVSAAAENLDAIEEELRFYFEDAYDEAAGLNEQNYLYLQKVDETIKRFDGNVVSPVFPMIMVTGPSTFLNPQPGIDGNPKGTAFDDSLPPEEQARLVDAEWKIADGYGRLVGATMSEKALTICAMVPQFVAGTESETAIPLIYTFVYEAPAVQDRDSYAFLYGQFHSFGELEKYKVYEDAYYAIYEMTDLFYTDLDAYLGYLQQIRPELMLDDQIRARIRNIYQYYKDRENLADSIYYLSLDS